jgi:hypothetical protein
MELLPPGYAARNTLPDRDMAFALPVIMADWQKKIWECLQILIVILPAGEGIIKVEMYICSLPD